MKRGILLIALISLLSPLASMGEGRYYAVSLSLFPYLSIPHYEDEIAVRTSGGGEASIGALGYRTGPYDVSLEMRYRGTTASIPHGFYRARGFDSFGLDLRFAYQLKEKLALSATLGSEINFYRKVDHAFASFSASIGGEYLLAQNPTYRLSLTFPLTVHLRKEITTVQTAVGLRYQLFPAKGGR
ncbi:MAG TPA: hypothetical protein PLX25_00740 [Sphaerochaeta sp.]|jgi:hypothetical protein|nr:hypothetical protein [Sphaerochaeta sp.]